MIESLLRTRHAHPFASLQSGRATQSAKALMTESLSLFALPYAREERIFLVKKMFATRQLLQASSKDALNGTRHAHVRLRYFLEVSSDPKHKDELFERARHAHPFASLQSGRATQSAKALMTESLSLFALPYAREERIFLVKKMFATRQLLQASSKDALNGTRHAHVRLRYFLEVSSDPKHKDELFERARHAHPFASLQSGRATQSAKALMTESLSLFALPYAREERIFLVKKMFATRQLLQASSKDALNGTRHAHVRLRYFLEVSSDPKHKDELFERARHAHPFASLQSGRATQSVYLGAALFRLWSW
ncbi:hypothetical protein [Thalassoglobus polymorphus]|uniref:Uncharacterized protein n=1 Tax=Thalassoglobus polymorphus TaxID=2527994 RepID=A0A517QIQ7_9PLAN|nr:hypothetical protein [Thalassoglobus polymorphus]QDT31488.1 hypothetical protein Mal48_07220 [Thalassoglobus polymorphus]